MPSVPIPPSVPIAGASWSTGLSPAGIDQASTAVGQPVNPTMSGLSQAGMQAQQALQGAQAKSALTDVQQKTRGMQASMLGALANLPPDQYEAQKSTTIGTINKLNPSWQFDPNMDQQTAKMNAMSAIPVEQQPIYGLNQQIPEIMKSLPGMMGASQSPAETAGQPGQQGTPLGGQVSPEVIAKMSLIPALKPVVDNLLKLQEVNQNSPTGKNTAEANKSATEASEGFNQAQKSIEALKNMIGNYDEKGNFIPNQDLPQSKLGISAQNEAWLSQNFGGQKEANAYTPFKTLNEAQTIKGIQSLADSGQIKMTKTLENIVNRGYLVDENASPQAKMDQANIVEAELKNSMIAAQNVATKMNGGQQTQPYQSPNAASQAQGKLRQKQPQSSTPIINTKTAYDALPSGSVYVESDGKKYRKP